MRWSDVEMLGSIYPLINGSEAVVDSELPLVEFWGLIPPHLLKVCSAHKDNIEIKSMGSIGGKTPT
jgi:hypothetical protein